MGHYHEKTNHSSKNTITILWNTNTCYKGADGPNYFMILLERSSAVVYFATAVVGDALC